MIAPLEFLSIVKRLFDIQEKQTYLMEERKDLESELRTKCNSQTVKHGGYKYETSERLGNIKYKDIPELKNVILDDYRDNPVTVCKLSYLKQFDI